MWRALRGIAINYLKLGDLDAFADPEKGLNAYQQGLKTFQSLPPEEQERLPNRRFEMQFQRKIGGALRNLQQWSEAEPYLSRARAFFEQSLATDPDDRRAKYDMVIILEAYMDLYDAQGKTRETVQVLDKMIPWMDDLLRIEPDNSTWHVARGYYRYKLATQLAQLGDQTHATAAGTEGLAELARVADPAGATPQALQLASEAYAEIQPVALRDGPRALAYAQRFAGLRPPRDAFALYRLAIAQNGAGLGKQAAETAHRALELLPPPHNGRVYYVRTELESIH